MGREWLTRFRSEAKGKGKERELDQGRDLSLGAFFESLATVTDGLFFSNSRPAGLEAEGTSEPPGGPGRHPQSS